MHRKNIEKCITASLTVTLVVLFLCALPQTGIATTSKWHLYEPVSQESVFKYVRSLSTTGFRLFVGLTPEERACVVDRLRDTDLLDSEVTQPNDTSPADGQSDVGDEPTNRTHGPKEPKPPLLTFVDSLPERKGKLLAAVKLDMESGRTNQMSDAAYHYADTIVCILIELCGYYPWEPFENKSPTKYFSDFIWYRKQWHYATRESVDPGFRGSSLFPLIAFDVAEDVEELVEEMVWALVVEENFDFDTWLRRWRDAE